MRIRPHFVACPGPAQRHGVSLLMVAAAALLDADGRVLVAQRQGGVHDGLWEFPGGKLEAGETPEQALVRELGEELGIETSTTCLTPTGFASHHGPDAHLVLLLFACRNWRGVPVGRQAQAVRWCRIAELYRLAMPPADVPLIDQLERLL